MTGLGLDKQYRTQLEYYCAVTRYTLFRDAEGCELPEDVHLETVTRADIADWEIPDENRPSVGSDE